MSRHLIFKLSLVSLFNPQDVLGVYLTPYTKIKSSIFIIVLSVYYLLLHSFDFYKCSVVKLIRPTWNFYSKDMRLIQKSPMAHRKFSQYHICTLLYNTTVIFRLELPITDFIFTPHYFAPYWLVLQATVSLLKLLNRNILTFSNDFFFIKSAFTGLPYKIYLM